MEPTGLELCRDLFHERPGGQGIGQGSKGTPLIEARGGSDVMSLAAGIPPEVSGWPRVPRVEVRSEAGKVGVGLLEGNFAGGMLKGSPGVKGEDTGIGHACDSHANTEEGSLSASRDTNPKLPPPNCLSSVAVDGLDNTFQGIHLEDWRQKAGSDSALALGQGNHLAGARSIHGLQRDLARGNALEDSS
eukprot:4420161-Alexandrium_andersonii.AAC.1